MMNLLKKLSFAVMFLTALTIHAQNDFWTLLERPNKIDESGRKIINWVNAYPDNIGMQYAKVNSFAETTREQGLVKFKLNNTQTPFEFIIENFEYTSEQDFMFHATGEQGSLTWYCKDGGQGGVLDLFTELYSIYPINRSEVLIMQHNMASRTPQNSCGFNSEKISKVSNAKSQDRSVQFCGNSSTAATIDVLALVTPNAASWVGQNFGTFGGWWLLQTTHNINQALVNSGITNQNVRVRTIQYTPTNAYNYGSNIEEAVNNMNINEFEQLRNQYKADILVLLTKEAYGNAYGTANSIIPSSMQKNCVVQVAYADETRYTFAHEVAHQLGAYHDELNTNVEDCAHGHTLIIGTIRRYTIMANSDVENYNPSNPTQVNKTRIQHFSNPNVKFNNVPTGKIINSVGGFDFTSNNFSIIQGAFSMVANNIPNPSLSITNISCSGSNTKNLSATLYLPQLGNLPSIPGIGIQGLAPYTYTWEIANSIGDKFQTIPNSNSLNFSFYLANYQYKVLRFTVTGSDGYSLSALKAVYGGLNHSLVQPNNGDISNGNSNEFEKRAVNSNELNIYPNPATNLLQIVAPNKGTQQISNIKLSNQIGIVLNLFPNIENNIDIDVSNYPSGLYFLDYSDGKKIISKKIIINH